MNDNDKDIFGDVNDTATPQETQIDPAKQLFLLPENKVSWLVPRKHFKIPEEIRDCTVSLVVRFVSWQIAAENQQVYAGSGVSTPGTLRNQMVTRFHPVPEGFEDDGQLRRRVPCMAQFGVACRWCAEKSKAEMRYPREQQPTNYFKDVIAKFKAKDITFMLGEVWAQDENGAWGTDGKLRAFEFSNFVRNGRTFSQIINDRANDADKRIRIDKKTYAGYVSPVAIKVTYSWPSKAGKPEKGQFSTWSPTDATPFPVEAGGPDVSKFSKEWAVGIAKHDPASWINRGAYAKLSAADAGQYVYEVFTGAKSLAPKVDLDTADLGQLLTVVDSNKAKFPDLNLAEFSYDDTEALRAIVKGVLNG